jgi:hypothetical protein
MNYNFTTTSKYPIKVLNSDLTSSIKVILYDIENINKINIELLFIFYKFLKIIINFIKIKIIL